MKNIAFIFLILIFATEVFGQQNYEVTATNGLILRNKAGRSGKRIGKIPAKSIVKILKKSSLSDTITDNGNQIVGNWVKVKTRSTSTPNEGYVFDGYLKETDIQDFHLAKPDSAKIKSIVIKSDYANNSSYVYLKSNYQTTSGKLDKKYFEGSTEQLCAFKQTFENGIEYSHSECNESGVDVTITFPYTELEEVKAFINTLFYDKENTWTSPLSYEADGVGCYYEIIQSEHKTVIEYYCGC